MVKLPPDDTDEPGDVEVHTPLDLESLARAMRKLEEDNVELRRELAAARLPAPAAAATPGPSSSTPMTFPPFVPPTGVNTPQLPTYSHQPPLVAQPVHHITYQLPRATNTAAPPDTFTGERTKALDFLRQLHRYFAGNPSAFGSDQQKINTALSYMKGGNAGPWSNVKTDMEIAGNPPFVSYADFTRQFLVAFGEADPQGSAIHRMKLLTQGGRSADEYIADFEALESLTGFNDIALVEEFQNGLRHGLLKDIYGVHPLPVTLMQWKAAASTLDNQHARFLERRKQSVQSTPSTSAASAKAPRAPAPPPAASVTHTPRTPDVVPMDVDRNQSTFRGRCFVCGQRGHKANERHTPAEVAAARQLEAQVRAILGNLTPTLLPPPPSNPAPAQADNTAPVPTPAPAAPSPGQDF